MRFTSLSSPSPQVKPYKQWALSRRALVLAGGSLVCFREPYEAGSASRVMRLCDLERASVSPLCDSVVTLHFSGGARAFTAIVETKSSLLAALRAARPALVVAVANSWRLRGRDRDREDKFFSVAVEADAATGPSAGPGPLGPGQLELERGRNCHGGRGGRHREFGWATGRRPRQPARHRDCSEHRGLGQAARPGGPPAGAAVTDGHGVCQ